MAIELIFETHSFSTDNERGVATGWLDGELSDAGKKSAKELGKRRQSDNLAAIFVSDSGRAIETARIAFEGSSIPLFYDWRLRECNYGALNGRPVAELAKQRPAHIYTPFPGGESFSDAVDRIRSFLSDVSDRWQGKHVLAIGHSATKWALDVLLSGAKLEDLVDAPFGWREGWSYTIPDPGAAKPQRARNAAR